MERKNENSLIAQASAIAEKVWEAYQPSQPADFVDKIAACLLVEDLVRLFITHHSPASQILPNVYVDRQEYPGRQGVNTARVAVTIINETVSKFITTGGIDSISFQTHPEWTRVPGAADLRWLIVGGSYRNLDDNLVKMWETEYIFNNLEIRKQQKTGYDRGIWRIVNTVPLEDPDLDLISSICLGIRDQVGRLLVRRKYIS